MSDSLNGSERETTVVATDDSDVVVIWSAQRKHITRMRKHGAFTEIRNGFYGTTEWAEFTVPADRWSPAGVKRVRNLTTEQREQAVARLRAAREKK